MQLSKGSTLGSYRIEEFVAAGGMGEVYKARHIELERWVAIKILGEGIGRDEVALGRFRREAKSASRLEHPHICRIYDFGEDGGRAFLVLEYLEGETLTERIARDPLSHEEIIKFGAEIAEALDHAHSHGLVHRDLKPDNVMLTESGTKILDFGIAKRSAPSDAGLGPQVGGTTRDTRTLTREGTLIGTLPYMAPEQVGGGDTDARTDIYALGVMLYELIAGRRPLQGRTEAALAVAILRDSPDNLQTVAPSTPAALASVVHRCLEKDPEKRWQTARDLADGLRSPMKNDSTGIRHVAPLFGRVMATSSRRAVAVSMGVVLIVGGVVWGGLYLGSQAPPPGPADRLDPTRIAVLPLEVGLGGRDLQAIADGFSRTLIEELDRVDVLDLLSWPATRSYRGTTETLSVIAHALEAGTLVEGSVREIPADGGLRVTITLIDGNTLSQIGSKTIEGTTLIQLQDSMVAEVARFLRERLGRAIQRSERQAGTTVEEAWALVQRGEGAEENAVQLVHGDFYRLINRKGAAENGEAAWDEIVRADSLFQLAEASDREWLEPIVLRGWLWATVAGIGLWNDAGGVAGESWLDVAHGHASRALEMDPVSPEALELRGTVRFRMWNSPGPESSPGLIADAEADLRAATGSPRSTARMLSTLSQIIRVTGRLSEARLLAFRAFEEDRFLVDAPSVLQVLAQTSLELEEDEEAMRWCNKGRERFPEDRYFLSCAMTTLAVSETLEPAVDTMWNLAERLIGDSPADFRREMNRAMAHFQVARLLARAELEDSARAVLDRAISEVPEHPDAVQLKYYEAGAWLQLGLMDRALDAVEELVTAVPERRPYWATDWWFRGLWDDPRFRALVASEVEGQGVR